MKSFCWHEMWKESKMMLWSACQSLLLPILISKTSGDLKLTLGTHLSTNTGTKIYTQATKCLVSTSGLQAPASSIRLLSTALGKRQKFLFSYIGLSCWLQNFCIKEVCHPTFVGHAIGAENRISVSHFLFCCVLVGKGNIQNLSQARFEPSAFSTSVRYTQYFHNPG